MASGQNHFNYSVYMILINNFSNQIDTMIIWCHDGAPGGKIFPGNCFINILRILIDHGPQCPDSAAVFYRNYYTAIFLYFADNFHTVSPDRTAGHKNPRSFFQMLTLFIFLQNLIVHSIYHLGSRRKIKSVFTALYHFLNILSCNRSRIQFHHITKIFESSTDAIIQMNSIPEHLLRYHDMKELFKILFCPDDLFSPEFHSPLRLAVWQLHYIDRFEFRHHFKHFFLSITRCLADYKIREMKKGTFI